MKFTDLHIHSEMSLKEISCLNGKYLVSTDGRIFNSSMEEKSQSISMRGYHRVKLHIGSNKYKHFSVHILVAEAFIPNPDNLPQVNHKDTNKLNNNVNNLEWISTSDNIRHAMDNGLYPRQLDNQHKASIANADRSSIEVEQLNKDGDIIDIFKNKYVAGRSTGISPHNIRRCCVGKCNTAGGFVWRYRGGGANV